MRGSITVVRLVARSDRAHPRSTAPHPQGSPVRLPGPHPVILLRVLDRPRLVLLSWALLSFVLFGLVALAVVQGWGPVAQFDDRGSPAADYAVDSHWLIR